MPEPELKEYVIFWDIGYGPNYEKIQAADEEEARKAAYDSARDDFENQVDYKCLGEATKELCEEYGV